MHSKNRIILLIKIILRYFLFLEEKTNKKVKEKALEAKCIPREVPQRNAFGLPTLSSILQDLRSVSNCSYIAYINSDIMLNPEIFSLLEFVSNHRDDYNLTQPVYIQLHTKW